MRGNTNRGATRRARAALGAVVVICAVTALLPGAASALPAANSAADGPAAGSTGGATAVRGPGAAGPGGPGAVAVSTAGVDRISVAADGTQGDNDSTGASITPDGRHIVFASSATNLTADAPTGDNQGFVHDRRPGQTKRLGNLAPLQPPVISGDGEYAAYPVQWMRNVRLRQFQIGTGASIASNCAAWSCNQASINADGDSIALVTYAHSPTPSQRVEVQDGYTTTTIATFGHTQYSLPSISGDGRYVAYQDAQAGDVFLRDRTAGTTTGPIEGASQPATVVQISDGGGKVVYLSGADTYVYDVATATSQLVAGVKGVAIDPTGRYLLYTAHAPNTPSLTLRDLRTGTDDVVSAQPATARTDAVSTGGRDVVFHSAANDIVPGDTNGKSDVFVRSFF
ncbi:hypothetical protein AB0G74_12940 [Streptomyces sp. NPDC020875]|uniref:hypothetical protein n=1 Tax=Streptomyces sp. NPDC020875 TaxID=3154898 RepID=UPI0033FCB3B2